MKLDLFSHTFIGEWAIDVVVISAGPLVMLDVVANLVVSEKSCGGGGRPRIPTSDHGGRNTKITRGFESERSPVHRQAEYDLFRRTPPAREDKTAKVTDSPFPILLVIYWPFHHPYHETEG